MAKFLDVIEADAAARKKHGDAWADKQIASVLNGSTNLDEAKDENFPALIVALSGDATGSVKTIDAGKVWSNWNKKRTAPAK